MTTYYEYHIGSEIGKLNMHGRDRRAALGWRCKHLKAREVRGLLAVLRAAKRRLHAPFNADPAGQNVAALDERLAHG